MCWVCRNINFLPGSSKGLEDFTYTDQDLADLILTKMKKVQFMGLPGLIKFNENHDAVSSLFVRRTEGKSNMIRVLKKRKIKNRKKEEEEEEENDDEKR